MKLFQRLNVLGYEIELTTPAKDFLSDKGYDPQYGARPLNRAIQKYLEDPIAEELLKNEISEGDTIVADYDGESAALNLTLKKANKAETE